MAIDRIDRENSYPGSSNVDDALQKEIEEALGGKSIEELVEAEEKTTPERNNSGGRNVITGTVVATNGPDIFVDYGGRGEGLLSVDQYSADEEVPSEGDKVKVVIEGFDKDAGLMRLSREGRITAMSLDSISKGQVVEGMVTGMNSGGLELKINGVRAFMPTSQVDIGHIEDLESFLNTKIQGIVQEARGKDLVVSRRELQKQIRAEQAEDTWNSLHEGRIVSGVVRNIMPYGAFVDIGGVDGLLHVRDMVHGRVEKPEEVVHSGQKIEVKVLSIDPETKKIGLGLKQTQADPWESAEIKWTPGSNVEGKVVKLMDFGAFVELEPGVEALIPISEMSYRRVAKPGEVVAVGDTVRAAVLKVDSAKKRISLSLKQAGDDPWEGASVKWAPDSVVEGPVTRVADFGAFVELAGGVEGLIHISELAERRVSNVRAEVEEGKIVKARVLSVDESGRRISLSIKQL